MIIEQISALNGAGHELLSQGQIKQAVLLFKEAREIMREYQFDSLKVFAQFTMYAEINPTFLIYTEFCARNHLTALCEEDYNAVIPPKDPTLLEVKTSEIASKQDV